MLEIARAHALYAQMWSSERQIEVSRRGLPDPQHAGADYPYQELWKANAVAYAAAEPEARALNAALGRLFDLVPWDGIRVGDPTAVDRALDFIEVDVRAFHCGYAKQWMLRRLKRVALSAQQVDRLAGLLVLMCAGDGWGHELRELTRLMIPHASSRLVEVLGNVASASSAAHASARATRTLAILRNGRLERRVQPHLPRHLRGCIQ